MILLSFRRDFTSRLRLSDQPQWRFSGGDLSGKRCLFLIHGYDNSDESAEGNFRAIESNLIQHGLLGADALYQQTVGVLWPGQFRSGFWQAESMADRVSKMLSAVVAGIPIASASFVTHSLGARVALGCIQQLGSLTLPLRDLVLLAPAVDDNCLDGGTQDHDRGRYYIATRRIARTLVCYSNRDEVLGVWFRRFSAIFNFNDVALGWDGPRDPSRCFFTVRTFNGTSCVDSHGAWMSCQPMYETWARGWPDENLAE